MCFDKTVLRYTQKFAHIIQGRELVKKLKLACHHCRALEKKAVEVAMGPVKNFNVSLPQLFT